MASFFNQPLEVHLLIGFVIRLILIFYADYHDNNYEVGYTDVDYKVFTDAARHVVDGNSPYKRHTYRYSPLIAFILVPNVTLYKNFGKILFSVFDLLITVAVKSIVKENLNNPTSDADRIALHSSLCWLYNWLGIAISTRGNADSVPCFFIILSILFLQTDFVKGYCKYALSGIMLGFAIHLRLYPLAFSFPMYLSLGEYKINRKTSLIKSLRSLIPNLKQIILALSCVITLFLLTWLMYSLYQYEFLFETYIYHLIRKDTRHNFSVLFYYSYLSSGNAGFDLVKTLVQISECCVLLMLSLTFGSSKETLAFGLFAQSVVMVAYNSVMTSQYFVWFLSLLPLVIHDLVISVEKTVFLSVLWTAAQGGWLYFAYQLEFKSQQVFLQIWLMGLFFFCANVYILSELINCYVPGYRTNRITMRKIKNN